MRESDSCRPGCGACCIAPSISSPIPGMPAGKPAGVRCMQLDERLRCRLFGLPQRPAVCASLKPSAAMCGADRQQALGRLSLWERQTAPVAIVRSTNLTLLP
ncbi:MAG: YkgJ family cysteine cluster protein [Burkholderiaceae bacterium]